MALYLSDTVSVLLVTQREQYPTYYHMLHSASGSLVFSLGMLFVSECLGTPLLSDFKKIISFKVRLGKSPKLLGEAERLRRGSQTESKHRGKHREKKNVKTRDRGCSP